MFMRALYARQPTAEERRELEAGLQSDSALTLRRCQIILLSVDEQLKVQAIGQRIGRSDQTVREVIHAFNEEGVRCVYAQPRGRQDDQRAFDDAAREQLRAMIRQSPREFGHDTSLWTLELIAAVSYEQGLTTWRVHKDTVSETLRQMGMPWKRAKRKIQSPDPNYTSKKKTRLAKSARLATSRLAPR
jgi:transposase